MQSQVTRVTTANTNAKSSASITTILRYPDSVINLIKTKCVNNSIIAYFLLVSMNSYTNICTRPPLRYAQNSSYHMEQNVSYLWSASTRMQK